MSKQEYINKYVENVKRSLNTVTNVYEFCDNVYCCYCPLRKECHLNGHCAETLYMCIDDISEVE